MTTTNCTLCAGTGIRANHTPCVCVCRAAFRARYNSLRKSANEPDSLAFISAVRRHLTDAIERALFDLHYVLAIDWKECCERIGCARADFFHITVAMEAKLGRALCTLQVPLSATL